MSSYRLLRSNKETGPFSQEAIIAMGFKPYDLIWVEGKSAGWRYPSELPEFKDHAPVIEEQPYDRFYKKPVVPARGTPFPQHQVAIPALQAETTTTTTFAPPEISRPAYAPAAAAVGRHIHVTLPSGNTLNVTTLSGRAAPATEKSVQPVPEERKPSFSESISAQPLFATVAETIPARKAEQIIEKESTHTGSNPQYYTAPAPAASFSWTTMMGMIIGIATLVGLGVMIGLSINRGKPQLAQVNENSLVQPKESTPPPVSSPAEHAPLINNTAVPPADNAVYSQAANTATPPPVTTQKQAPPVVNKEINSGSHAKTAMAAKKDTRPITNKPVDKQAPEVVAKEKDPIVVHPKAAEAVPAVNLEKQVNIHTNGYKVGAFGGISDLQCTVVNDSRYALESVEVELQYIQANDKVFKTEKLSFRDIGAGTQVTMNAPKSTRGIKIISRIVKINTREPGLAAISLKS